MIIIIIIKSKQFRPLKFQQGSAEVLTRPHQQPSMFGFYIRHHSKILKISKLLKDL